MASRFPHFWREPIRYIKWASHEKPAIFYSIIIASMGPLTFLWVPPLRRYFNDKDPPPIPLTYPIPKGPRNPPAGYED